MKNVDLINIQRSLKRLRITHNIFLPIIFFELLIHKHLCEKFFSLLSKKKYKFNIKNWLN